MVGRSLYNPLLTLALHAFHLGGRAEIAAHERITARFTCCLGRAFPLQHVKSRKGLCMAATQNSWSVRHSPKLTWQRSVAHTRSEEISRHCPPLFFARALLRSSSLAFWQQTSDRAQSHQARAKMADTEPFEQTEAPVTLKVRMSCPATRSLLILLPGRHHVWLCRLCWHALRLRLWIH